LAADAATPRFALTYPCESIVAAALTALFGEPAARQPLDADPRAVAAWLAGARGERASGALFVDAGDDAWSILLLGDGAVVAGYGSDDRSLKPGIDDVTVLLHRERLWATRLAPAICDLSSAFTEPASPVTDDAVGDDLLALEAALIAALARLEHALTTATDSESAARAQRVADAFATVFADLVTLPAIAATVAMLPEDAGLSERIDLFQECIAHAVAPLAASDDSSARYLKDAANELVHQARAAVRR
jgi:plasmid stabilization system protein ParE